MITLLLFFLLAVAASATNIPLGSTLSAADPNSRWRSPNATFFLSFVPDPDAHDGTLIAAVTYNGIPVWKAGPSANDSAVLRLLPSGDLQLLPSPTSSSPLWSSATANLGVSAASLEDSGSLVLRNSSGAAVWSTFDHPTDTIVPAQRLRVNYTLFSGLYSFRIQTNGNLTLLWNNTIIYYNSGLNSTSNSNLTNPFLEIQTTGLLTLSDPTLSSPLLLAYSNDYGAEGDIFRFLKLDADGNLRIYSSAGGSATVNVGWAAVGDQCQVYGFCGNMGICSYNDTYPICECPSQNFDFIDPNDSRKGCTRKVELQGCPGREAMLQLDSSRFLTFQPESASQIFYLGITPCRLSCLTGSACTASTSLSDGSGQCYLKLTNFVSGYRSPAIPSISFVKVCQPVLPNPSRSSSGNQRTTEWRIRVWMVVVLVLATILLLGAVEGGIWWCCCRNNPKFGGLSAQYALLEYASGAPVQFSFKELHKATKSFQEKLGSGGFGAVYKGVLANRTVVAVKQLEGIDQGEKQFRMEVATISSTHHLNLVRLIGFCSEGRHRLLVYEFMKNGSLDSFLFTKSGKILNWESRFSIALGTARGIAYLHKECRDCIVHCDIKPENILLDENMHAKVSDFGLAKLIVNPKNHRHRSLTSVRGTRGYLAPEWLGNLPITAKSDVYSYGMVLLEVVSGRRNFEVSPETGGRKLWSWAYEELEKGNLEGILDERVVEMEADGVEMEQARRAVQVSFWCIQEQPSQRPDMGKVVHMLEGILAVERPPPPRAAAAAVEGSVGSTSTAPSSVSSTAVGSAAVGSVSSSIAPGKNLERGSSEVK